MRKSGTRKLTLQRETLRDLSAQSLKDVAGGSCATCIVGTCTSDTVTEQPAGDV